ncbi:MAG: hypothetical protein U0Y68_15550 [Blastocatellia bacterium]
MFLTIKQLAEKLCTQGESLAGVEQQIHCWVRDTDIACHQAKRRGKLRFFWPEVDRWLKQRKKLPHTGREAAINSRLGRDGVI